MGVQGAVFQKSPLVAEGKEYEWAILRLYKVLSIIAHSGYKPGFVVSERSSSSFSFRHKVLREEKIPGIKTKIQKGVVKKTFCNIPD